jgi:hypothetical protein
LLHLRFQEFSLRACHYVPFAGFFFPHLAAADREGIWLDETNGRNPQNQTARFMESRMASLFIEEFLTPGNS